MGTYLQLGDVRTWFAEYGDGEPVVLLHGGFVDSRSFDPAIPLLAERFHVFTPDRRGHGRTADVAGPISYELMAADTIAFVERQVKGPAHLVGYSDGANVAMIVALRRPDLVRKLVLLSGNFHHGGLAPGLLEGFRTSGAMERLAARYGEVSPDGREHFPVVVDKSMRMAASEPNFAAADLSDISARTLILAADDDAMSLEHTIAAYRAIPDSELAIVPGTSHLLVVEKPDKVYRIVLDFLTEAPAATYQPIRRAAKP